VLHADQQAKSRIWHAGYMTYDLAGFFQSEDNPDLVFVEVAVERARLLGPGFTSEVWSRA
jgi:general stress protein 26